MKKGAFDSVQFWLVPGLGTLALVILLPPALSGGCLAYRASCIHSKHLSSPTADTDDGEGTTGGSLGDPLGSVQLALATAASNTTWATYVVTAVGILFVLVSVITASWNEARHHRLEEEWRRAQGNVRQSALSLERRLSRVAVPLASYMVTSALYEMLYAPRSERKASRMAFLRRSIIEGVKILVRRERDYSAKADAVRYLSKVIDNETLDALDEIENSVRAYPASKERQVLLQAIQMTRKVVGEALEASRRAVAV